MGGGGLASIQGLPQYQNIIAGLPRVGEVALLQDDHGLPDVFVGNFTLSAILIDECSLQPSTGHSCGPAPVDNGIQYICGYLSVQGGSSTDVSFLRPCRS